jgi:hypothetical protein
MRKPTRFVWLSVLLVAASACGEGDDAASDYVHDARDDGAGGDAAADADAHAEVPGDDGTADAPSETSDSAADESPPDASDVAADGTDGSGSVCGGLAGFRCPEGETCDVRVCWTDATGTCVPDPDVCTDLRAPVCGCDGVTYGNDCLRIEAGAALDYDGECATPVSCKPECQTGADGTLGWTNGCTDAFICVAACTGCSAECQAVGSRSQGWYAVCSEPGAIGGCRDPTGAATLILWDRLCAP